MRTRGIAGLVVLGWVVGCSAPVAPAADAGQDARGIDIDANVEECSGNPSCDDGVFCNGRERCTSSGCAAGAAVDCGARACDEDRNRCECEADADEDDVCAADDCDDADPTRFPGNEEVCDTADHDEDCDSDTFGMRDLDGNRFYDAACCNEDGAGALVCGNDCDDTNPARHHAQIEVCNGIDDNCNGEIDEGGVSRTFFPDADGDGFGSGSGTSISSCSPPAGYAANGTDCDDADASVHPGAVELCNDVDDDCDGTSDASCPCSSGSARPCSSPGRCAAGTEMCIAGAWGSCSIIPIAETCNAVDDDCDGTVDEGCP